MTRFRVLPSAPTLALAAAFLACADGTAPHDAIARCLEDAGVSGAAVAILEFAFHPSTLTVPVGSTVTWVNCERPGEAAHTTTSEDGLWDSGSMTRGDTFTHTFEEPGSYPYFCLPHPAMVGTIQVEAGG